MKHPAYRRSPSIRSPSSPLPLVVGEVDASRVRRLPLSLAFVRLTWHRIVQLTLALVVVWFELALFHFHGLSTSFTCSSSDDPSSSSSSRRPREREGFNVLIVTDPQVLDSDKSYPDRPTWLRRVSIAVTNRYLRKSWLAVTSRTTFDAVVWNGDLLDNGRDMNLDEYSKYARQFHKLFPLPRQQRPRLGTGTGGLGSSSSSSSRRLVLDPPVPVIYVPGNHDLVLEPPPSSSSLNQKLGDDREETNKKRQEEAKERFKEWFGPLWGRLEWNGWDMVWIDAIELINHAARSSSSSSSKTNEMIEWLKSDFGRQGQGHGQGQRQGQEGRILFSHVPLFRPGGTACLGGNARESRARFGGGIRDGFGQGYQNLVGREQSEWVLFDSIEPVKVFSGDDHDYCFVRHENPSGSGRVVTETTVKSFSMSMGVSRPGYTILTLYAPPPSPSTNSSTPAAAAATSSSLPWDWTERSCVLPDQLGIYLGVYLPLALALYVVLVVPRLKRVFQRWWNKRERNRRRRRRGGGGGQGTRSRTRRRHDAVGKTSPGSTSPSSGGREERDAGEQERDDDEKEEDEEEDALFPTTFGGTGNHGVSSEYGYSASLGRDDGGQDDEGELVSNRPSPLRKEILRPSDHDYDEETSDSDDESVSSIDEGERGDSRSSRVRRVSRVWSWEKPAGGSSTLASLLVLPSFTRRASVFDRGGRDGEGYDYGDDEDDHRKPWTARAASAVTEFLHQAIVARLSQNSLVVPVLRRLRPVVRLARTAVFVVCGKPLEWLTVRASGGGGGRGGDDTERRSRRRRRRGGLARAFTDAAKEFSSCVSVGILVWAGIWVWAGS